MLATKGTRNKIIFMKFLCLLWLEKFLVFRIRRLQSFKESLQQSTNSTAEQKPLDRPDYVCQDQSQDQQSRRIDSGAIKAGKHNDDDQHRRCIEDRHQAPEVGSIEKVRPELRILRLQPHMGLKVKIRKDQESRCQQHVTNRRC